MVIYDKNINNLNMKKIHENKFLKRKHQPIKEGFNV